MKLNEDEIYRIASTLQTSLDHIKELLQVKDGSRDYYVYLIEEQTATEKLLKRFEDELAKF